MTLPVIAVVGPSNSGKTRVATTLTRVLTAWGYRVAAVKHTPHGHQVDRPATDSARLLEAGASAVVLSAPGQRATVERVEGDAPLEEIAASLGPGYDLVVAEGFKDSTVPKVLVMGDEPLSPVPQHVVAVVSDRGAVEGVPTYSFQELEGLARQLRQLLDR